MGHAVELEAIGQRRSARGPFGVRTVDERQPALQRAAPRRRADDVGQPALLGSVRLGRADDDDPVGERERQLGPPRVGGIQFEDEVVVGGLGLVQELQQRRLGDRQPGLDETLAPERGVDARRPQVLDRPVAGDLLGQPCDEQVCVERDGDRHGDRPCPVGVGVAPSDAGEDRARQLQHQRRVGGGQRAEGLDAEAGERAVAQRGHRGAAGRSLDHSHLTDDLAACDLTDHRAALGSPPACRSPRGSRRPTRRPPRRGPDRLAGARAHSTRRPRRRG